MTLKATTEAFLWYAPDETDPTYNHMVAEGYDD